MMFWLRSIRTSAGIKAQQKASTLLRFLHGG